LKEIFSSHLPKADPDELNEPMRNSGSEDEDLFGLNEREPIKPEKKTSGSKEGEEGLAREQKEESKAVEMSGESGEEDDIF